MKGYCYYLPIILALGWRATPSVAQAGTQWVTLSSMDSAGADVLPQGFTGFVDPINPEQECKGWCLSVPTCTMFLYWMDGSGKCYIKTGSPDAVPYQIRGTGLPYALVMRDMTCALATTYITPYLKPTDSMPPCTESIGNTDEGEDEVPRGALNEPCLADSSCLNGNVCDALTDGSRVCKSPYGGFCRELSDCSSSIQETRLECTLDGGSNGNRICSTPFVQEPEPPAPSQDAMRKKRNALKARMMKRQEEQCPQNTVACPISEGANFECVNAQEELAHCGSCGNDCQALPGVHHMGVMCAQGNCLIYRCRKGFKLVDDICMPKQAGVPQDPTVRRIIPRTTAR